jgi:hypothetical protein
MLQVSALIAHHHNVQKYISETQKSIQAEYYLFESSRILPSLFQFCVSLNGECLFSCIFHKLKIQM